MLGFDRKAVPEKLELTYRKNRSRYQDLRGRPIRSKPLYHRDPSIELVPSRYTASLDDPGVTEPETGRLELVLDSAATMPVAAIDGEPVAVGDGTVYVVLPAGLWTVDVQSGETISPVVVDIADQEKTRLFWSEGLDGRVSLGASATDFQAPVVSKVYLYEWLTLVFILCCTPTGVVMGFNFSETASRVIIGIVAAVGLFLAVMYPWKRRERARVDSLHDERKRAGRSMVRTLPENGPAFADRPALLGDDPDTLPGFVTGHGALLLRLKASRHLWKDGDGVCARDIERARLWLKPPTVRIDGFEQKTTWGNWWYPLQPGKRLVEVEYDAALFGAPQLISERFEFEVQAGEAAAVRAAAHAFVDRGPGESGPVQVRKGMLFIKAEEFSVAWMDDPGKRVAFWTTHL